MKTTKYTRNGFTLIEILVSCAVFAITSACLAIGMVALLQAFNGSSNYAQKHAAEMRVSDYIAMDLRRAQSVTISGSGSATAVTLNIPNFYVYNAGSNPPYTHRLPTVTGSGVFYRDSSTNPAVDVVQVRYTLSNGNMLRVQTGGLQTGAALVSATTTVIASNVLDFQLSVLSCTGTANAGSFNIPLASATSGKVAEVKTQINFGSTYTTHPVSNGGSAFCNTTLMRNSSANTLYQ